MLLQLPRAGASLIALASLPRCQSAVPVQGHREPKSGGVCSGRAGERVPSVRERARASPPPKAKRAQAPLDIYTGIPLKRVDGGGREPRPFPPPPLYATVSK